MVDPVLGGATGEVTCQRANPVVGVQAGAENQQPTEPGIKPQPTEPEGQQTIGAQDTESAQEQTAQLYYPIPSIQNFIQNPSQPKPTKAAHIQSLARRRQSTTPIAFSAPRIGKKTRSKSPPPNPNQKFLSQLSR